MKYNIASHVLINDLLKEVQRYAPGEVLYIPELPQKKQWSEGSGARRFYEGLNAKVRAD